MVEYGWGNTKLNGIHLIEHETIEIIIPGNPVPLQRPRFYINKEKNKSGVFDGQSRVKDWYRCTLRANTPKTFSFDSNSIFDVDLRFEMLITRSSSQSKKKRIIEEFTKQIINPHSKKPDLDNLCKFVFDIGNNILWPDDSKIFCLRAEKYYSENPKTIIIITKYQNEK